jgi:L-fucose isomerase-like protein
MIDDFVPVARVILGLSSLKIITFGPRPQDFFACNAPIKALYDLGVEDILFNQPANVMYKDENPFEK